MCSRVMRWRMSFRRTGAHFAGTCANSRLDDACRDVTLLHDTASRIVHQRECAGLPDLDPKTAVPQDTRPMTMQTAPSRLRIALVYPPYGPPNLASLGRAILSAAAKA